MSTRKRKSSTKVEGKSSKKAKAVKKTKDKTKKGESAKSLDKQDKDNDKDKIIQRLEKRVEKLEQELMTKSRDIVVIIDQMYNGEAPNVDVYYNGPGAELAWKYACSDAYETGETPVARITVPEPIQEHGQGYIKHSEFLHPNGNKSDLRLAAGIESDEDVQGKGDCEISLATDSAVVQRGVESESD